MAANTQWREGGRPCRVAWVVSSPTPYKLPFFKLLSERPELDITFYYLVWEDPQRPWGLNDEGGVDHKVLPGIAIRSSWQKKSYLRLNPTIWAELRNGSFDVVVICGYNHPTLLMALSYCLVSGTRFFLQGESHTLKRRGAMTRWLKKVFLFPLLRRADAALATGRLAMDYWADVGIDRHRMRVVANTPDVDYFRKTADSERGYREELRKDLGLTGPAVGIFVGRFVAAKGLEFLLESLKRLEPENRPELLLVGEGPLEQKLRAEVIRFGLPVRFLGFQQMEDLPSLYACADFFVLPSNHEPWGVVVNEAMAAGLPVVVSDQVGAAYDLVVEGENGFVVPVNDLEAWSEVLYRCRSMSSDALLEMGRRSQEIVAGWTHESSVENFLDALDLSYPQRVAA